MQRDDALKLMEQHVATANLRKHMLACAVTLEALADRLGQDRELYYLTGLLHDLDYDLTKDDPGKHGLETAAMLEPYDLPGEMLHAIKAHADKAPVESTLDICLYAADPVTGFIVACALIRPDKSLASVDLEFMLKRWKEKRFAAGADREQMDAATRTGLTREEFLTISLKAMQAAAGELGL